MKAMHRNPALALALSLLAGVALAAEPQPPTSQEGLKPVLNRGADAPSALKFDWPMLKIGQATYEEGPTGVTVFRFGRKVMGAVDARGGGPGTVNADYLRLGYDAPELDAVVLSGGSWYGLESVTAVDTALKDSGERSGHWDNIGLAVGSIIYDFGPRRLNEIYPDKRLAQAALGAAQPGVFAVGPYGAGRSAVNGGLFDCNAKSGQGGAFRQFGETKVAVFTVVNALGVVTDRAGRVVACNGAPGWPKELKASDLMAGTPGSLRPDWAFERKNTTISLVVTNRKMTPAELQRIAVQVHTSMARGIQPFATEFDGDVLYAVSTGEVETPAGSPIPSVEIGTVASELMWDAILSAVPPQPQALAPATLTAADAGKLRSYAGDYQFSSLASLKVTATDGRLFAQATGLRDVFAIKRDAPTELLPAGPGVFTVPGRYPLSLRFERDRVVVNPGTWEQVGRRQGP